VKSPSEIGRVNEALDRVKGDERRRVFRLGLAGLFKRSVGFTDAVNLESVRKLKRDDDELPVRTD